MGICPHLHGLGDPTWSPAVPSGSIGLPEIHLQPCEDILIPKGDQNGATHLCLVTPKTLTVLYRPHLFLLPQIPLSPPKPIQVQTASLTLT